MPRLMMPPRRRQTPLLSPSGSEGCRRGFHDYYATPLRRNAGFIIPAADIITPRQIEALMMIAAE